MEYEDIQVLECNNLSSTQYKGGNQDSPAIFTNKMGDNIELKRGDKVNLQYAFINEKGCGLPQAIEVKGRNLTDPSGINVIKKNFKKSVIKSYGANTYENQQSLVNYIGEKIEDTTVEKILRDDEINIEINYYKNMNGEGYIQLPRRFDGTDQVLSSETDANKPYTSQVLIADEYWDEVDTVASGRPYYPIGTPQDTMSICEADTFEIFDGSNTAGYDGVTVGYLKHAQDGSRYTILARDITPFYPAETDDNGENINWEQIYDDMDKEEHAGNYHIYTDLLTIKVDNGFNSPENIATSITEQLQEAQNPVEYGREDDGDTPHFHYITSSTDTNTYKAMNCAWYGGLKLENYTAFHKVAPTNEEKIEGINFASCYEYIGCKRPELFVAGRKLNTWDETELYIKNTIASVGGADNTTDPIVTSWEWESDELVEPFLILMSNLFKEQYKYPELLGYQNDGNSLPTYTRENSRFLHINRYTQAAGNISNLLGYSNREDKGANRCSMPIFFKFDPNYEDVMTNGLNINKLSYGFATKTLVGDKYYITLHPELIGGIPSGIFTNQPATTITQNTTLIGWDWNFNAFSTCCCLLYSGVVPYSYDGLTQPGLTNYTEAANLDSKSNWNVAKYFNKSYIGANNSALEYTDNHFQFAYLHTSENRGQSFDAGSDATNNPIQTDANQEVYYINKRFENWTWCPDLKPYRNLTEYKNNLIAPKLDAAGGAEPGDVTLEDTVATDKLRLLNVNVTPYSIMDSHTGVYFNLGKSFDKENWRDGLLGILGFTWEQFNPTEVDNNNNRLARVEYKNIKGLEYLTTNSQMVTTDTKDYVINRYGGIMYTTQLPIPQLIWGWGQRTHPSQLNQFYYGWGIYPPIVEQTESILVNSQELPITMLRSYYSIRSDLILQENNKYMGSNDSGIRLPVIAVINKENGDGDFYFSSPSELEFTITQDINLSSITTSIHDPNGRLANLNNGSGVIYKVSRIKELDNTIIEEILGKKKSKM